MIPNGGGRMRGPKSCMVVCIYPPLFVCNIELFPSKVVKDKGCNSRCKPFFKHRDRWSLSHERHTSTTIIITITPDPPHFLIPTKAIFLGLIP